MLVHQRVTLHKAQNNNLNIFPECPKNIWLGSIAKTPRITTKVAVSGATKGHPSGDAGELVIFYEKGVLHKFFRGMKTRRLIGFDP